MRKSALTQIVLSMVMGALFSEFAYADESRIKRGPARIVTYDDYWLSTWEPEKFDDTDTHWRYKASEAAGEHMCMVKLEEWSERYGAFVTVQVRYRQSGDSFKTRNSPWLFTLTEGCKLVWENTGEQESLLHLMSPSRG